MCAHRKWNHASQVSHWILSSRGSGLPHAAAAQQWKSLQAYFAWHSVEKVRGISSRNTARGGFAALSGQMKPPQCCFQHWCEVQLQSRTGHSHIPHAVAGHLPLQSHICKKEIAITDSLFRFRWVNKSGANYMTILSSFSASFPPHYDTILAINCDAVHSSAKTWQIDGQTILTVIYI